MGLVGPGCRRDEETDVDRALPVRPPQYAKETWRCSGRATTMPSAPRRGTFNESAPGTSLDDSIPVDRGHRGRSHHELQKTTLPTREKTIEWPAPPTAQKKKGLQCWFFVFYSS